MRLVNNLPVLVSEKMKLKVNEDAFDQSDIHYLESNPKMIKKGEIVEVIGCWMNFNGSYIRCKYKDQEYDIKPKSLVYEKL